MNAIEHKERARDRLADAALRQLFDERPAVTRPETRPGRRALAAAMLAAGIGVVAATAWLGREPAGDENVRPGQDPRSLPDVETVTIAEIEQVAATVQNLAVTFSGDVDLTPLGRFRQLRRLQVLSDSEAEVDRNAAPFAAADFAPLAPLAALEELSIVSHRRVTSASVEALAGLPRLHALHLGRSADMAPPMARAIAALPELRRLELSNLPIRPSFLRALPQGLEHLGLRACPGLDVPAYVALPELRSLRSLAITSQANEIASRVDGALRPMRDLGEAAFRAFRELPRLASLDLDECGFEDRFLDELPASLQSLDLGARPMSPESILALRRLSNLRELAFDHDTQSLACSQLLATLPLEVVTLHGRVDETVVAALARHPTLTEIRLTLRRPVALAALRDGPRLRRVKLRYAGVLADVPNGFREELDTLRDRGIAVEIVDEQSPRGR